MLTAAENQAATMEGKMQMTCGTFFEYADTPDCEELLDWQVGEARTTELGKQLEKVRDCYKRQSSDSERQVMEGRIPRPEADRCRRIRARRTVRRTVELIKNEAWNARRDWLKAKYKSDGFDIPKPNVEELMNEIGKQQNAKLIEIVLG